MNSKANTNGVPLTGPNRAFTPPAFNPAKRAPDNAHKIRAGLRREIPNLHNKLVTMIDGDSWQANAARWLVRPTINVGLSGVFSPLSYVNCTNSLGSAARMVLERLDATTCVVAGVSTSEEGPDYSVGPSTPITPDNVAKRLGLDDLPKLEINTSRLTEGFAPLFDGATTLEMSPIGQITRSTLTTASENSVKYPKYFKSLPQGVSPDDVDTYAIAQMFPVDDPSGAILHARKKLLIPGVRSGGKSMRKDIIEARDTLNRWLELNPEA